MYKNICTLATVIYWRNIYIINSGSETYHLCDVVNYSSIVRIHKHKFCF